ncbi:MAG: hypothetical protein ACI90V_002059 [Bacillariaceae sp.]|jgi:hypothetical protein
MYRFLGTVFLFLLEQTVHGNADASSSSSSSTAIFFGTASLDLIPASPDCWLEAIEALKKRSNSVFFDGGEDIMDGEDGSKVVNDMTCSSMTSEDQKFLALELSRCHLLDLGRPLFQFKDEDERNTCSQTMRDCSKNDGSQQANNIATNCLIHLTDPGVSTYTHFFSYVNQLCTRLLSETIFGMYYQTSNQLARSSKIAESKMQILIEQQDVLLDRWNEREKHVQEKFRGLERFQKTLAIELERHQEEFEILYSITRKARSFIEHWSYGNEYIARWFKVVYSLFRGAIYNICGILVVCVITIPMSFRWMRGYMVTMILMELLTEFGIKWISDDGLTYINTFDTIRLQLFYGIGYFYLAGIFLSALCGCFKGRGESEIEEEVFTEPIEESENEDTLEQNRSQNNPYSQVESPTLTRRSTHQNPAFVPFPPPQPLFVTPDGRFTTQGSSNNEPILCQQMWNQGNPWVYSYHTVASPPPPPQMGATTTPVASCIRQNNSDIVPQPADGSIGLSCTIATSQGNTNLNSRNVSENTGNKRNDVNDANIERKINRNNKRSLPFTSDDKSPLKRTRFDNNDGADM